MVYVVFTKDDCPNIPFYMFLWYFGTIFKRMFQNIRYNFKHMEFGNIGETFHKNILNIFYVHRMVDINYNIRYKKLHQSYMRIICHS